MNGIYKNKYLSLSLSNFRRNYPLFLNSCYTFHNAAEIHMKYCPQFFIYLTRLYSSVFSSAKERKYETTSLLINLFIFAV
jgi:hypothetical protein